MLGVETVVVVCVPQTLVSAAASVVAPVIGVVIRAAIVDIDRSDRAQPARHGVAVG